MRVRVLVTALALTTAACGVQPSGPPAPVGLRLRVTHGICPQGRLCDAPAHARLEGRLIFASYDSVVIYSLKDRREFALPVEAISKLEVHRGKAGSPEAAAKHAAKGALIGALGGAAVGLASAVSGSILGYETEADKEIAAGAAAGAILGTAAGAHHGATVGDDVWQEVTIRRLFQDLCRCEDPEGARPDSALVAAQ